MIELLEALSMLTAAVQMGCFALVAAIFPIWAIQALSE